MQCICNYAAAEVSSARDCAICKGRKQIHRRGTAAHWLTASQFFGAFAYAGGGLRKFRKRRNLVHPTTAKNKKPEDIMSEINLKQVSTEQLVEELKTREGVAVQALDLGEKSDLSVSRWMTMLLVVD